MEKKMTQEQLDQFLKDYYQGCIDYGKSKDKGSYPSLEESAKRRGLAIDFDKDLLPGSKAEIYDYAEKKIREGISQRANSRMDPQNVGKPPEIKLITQNNENDNQKQETQGISTIYGDAQFKNQDIEIDFKDNTDAADEYGYDGYEIDEFCKGFDRAVEFDLNDKNVEMPLYHHEVQLQISCGPDKKHKCEYIHHDKPAKPIKCKVDESNDEYGNYEEVDKFRIKKVRLYKDENTGNLDLSNPENYHALKHPEILKELIEMKPELLATVPAVIFNLNKEELLESFEKGLKANISNMKPEMKKEYSSAMEGIIKGIQESHLDKVFYGNNSELHNNAKKNQTDGMTDIVKKITGNGSGTKTGTTKEMGE